MVMVSQKSQTDCFFNVNFGCASEGSIYVSGGCRGDFTVNGVPITCSSSDHAYQECRKFFVYQQASYQKV